MKKITLKIFLCLKSDKHVHLDKRIEKVNLLAIRSTKHHILRLRLQEMLLCL